MAYYKCGKIFATQNSNTSIATASGAIANFNTSLAMPVLGCIAEFSASQASGTPTPSAPIAINGVNAVKFTRTGKNLFRGYGEKTYIKSGTAYLLSSANTTGASRIRFQVFDKDNNVLSNVTALSGCNGAYYWSGNVLVRANNTTTLNDKIGFDDNRVSSIVAIDDLSTAYHYVNYTNIQLELGSTATEYEAYNGTTAIINLGGTYYRGSVDAVTGKITLTHQIYNSLGSDISNVVKDSNSWRIYYSSAIYGTDNQYKEGLCDKLAFKTSYSGVNGNNNSIGFPASAGTQILIRNDALTTAQEVKDFMATLNVVYPLAEPIVVYASNTAEIPTIVGDNQVYADTGDVEVKYKKII